MRVFLKADKYTYLSIKENDVHYNPIYVYSKVSPTESNRAYSRVGDKGLQPKKYKMRKREGESLY